MGKDDTGSIRFPATANANVQKQINVSAVFHYIRDHGPTYRAAIARDLGLSAPGVSRAIDELISVGFVTEGSDLRPNTAKRISHVQVNRQFGYVIGVDLLKGNCKLGTFDFAGSGVPYNTGRDLSTSTNIISEISNEISMLIESTASDDSMKSVPLVAIGVGIPAAVRPTDGTIMGLSLYERISDINFKTELEDKFGVPVVVENDIKLAAFAENHFGQGSKHQRFLYLDLNAGIGAGIIADGEIVRGFNGFAGEIGYSYTVANTITEDTVLKKNLEAKASLRAIAQEGVHAVQSSVDTKLNDFMIKNGSLQPNDVFRAAADGDEAAQCIVRRAIEHIAVVAINAVLLVDPEAVIIGGDICNMPSADSLFVEVLQNHLNTGLPFEAPEVAFSDLGAFACVRGAGQRAIEQITKKKYPLSIPAETYH